MARLGAYSMHAKHDSHRIAANARRGFLAKFEREVDPDGTLDPADRERRARSAMRAHMTRIAMKRRRRR